MPATAPTSPISHSGSLGGSPTSERPGQAHDQTWPIGGGVGPTCMAETPPSDGAQRRTTGKDVTKVRAGRAGLRDRKDAGAPPSEPACHVQLNVLDRKLPDPRGHCENTHPTTTCHNQKKPQKTRPHPHFHEQERESRTLEHSRGDTISR